MDIVLVRAHLISILWSLKIAIRKHPSGIDAINYIHFNSILRDEDYRQIVLQAAVASKVPEIRSLAEDALAINIPGQLIGRSEDSHESTIASQSRYPIYRGYRQ
jgi:hypothetical protein